MNRCKRFVGHGLALLAREITAIDFKVSGIHELLIRGAYLVDV